MRTGEVAPDHARDWIEFADPAAPSTAPGVVRADLTFLLSRWTCVYGRGCHGVEPDRPDDGCCTHGAYFSDAEDEARTLSAAGRLRAKSWQYAPVGRREGIAERDELDGEPARRTRLVDGACVFLNRSGFAGGEGCALHALALREDRHPLETKPDVCWQLPLRRSAEQVERADGVSVLLTTVAEFDRRGWGPGGADLAWWCTSSPEAHVGAEPVYLSLAAELTALLGAPAYAELARLCDERRDRLPAHPASQLSAQASNL